MRNEIAPEREASREELLLRATLQAHSGEAIDTDAAWAAVAPRVVTAAGSVTTRRRAGPLAHVSRGILIAAAVVALVVALAGAGVGAAYWGGLFGGPKAQLIGDERLYTTIGQRQTHDSLTVTIDQAYADPGNTYIAVTFTMPDALARKYTHVIANQARATDANGNEDHGLNMACEPLWHDPLFHRDGVEHCLMDFTAFQPAAGASALNLNVEIGELWLIHAPDGQRDILTGPWSFSFSLPFHQQSLGPGGPYAEPGTTTPSDPGTKKP